MLGLFADGWCSPSLLHLPGQVLGVAYGAPQCPAPRLVATLFERTVEEESADQRSLAHRVPYLRQAPGPQLVPQYLAEQSRELAESRRG